ncbi:indolepyruvate ferredoxin oxidoreductase subunit alpha [Oceanicella sp. SM1341]|uniref:thiamine pyrophosphate-dependent enzyme n=1 Tax=Oceanicella sp. SM1341 TaxID=1548889 RepID=UPI000E48AA2C|nr:indolepyruvate ferredoxin oxidoreductase subunit alpha [Oceanicella sp. SM1341]
MAERSFAKEVQKLRMGAGEEFSGEGILAITKALLENGVGYVGGYQGAPISHLMDVLSDAQEILGELGVHFEASASEATATAMLSASVHYPVRGAVTYKSVVGTNVASDALANLASGGVTGGALIICGEDYGEGSSIMQERSHAFAMKSQVWLLDPRPNVPSIVKCVGDGFALSEVSNTPVMMQVRIRCCHVHGSFIASDNRKPEFSVRDAMENPRRDTARIVLPPASFLHEKEKLESRKPAAIKFLKDNKINEFLGGATGKIGIVMQGGMYNGVIRALQRMGLANAWGDTDVPLYVMNCVYPVVEDEFLEFCEGKDAVLIVEEGHPDYLEQNFAHILYKAGRTLHLGGKDVLPMGGEYTGKVMLDGISAFVRDHAPEMLAAPLRAPNREEDAGSVPDLTGKIPGRPPGFCVGCPERPIFAATKLVEEEMGKHHISSDIGCHLFSSMPPFELGATTMGYGLGPASASAFHADGARRTISFVGDGGFWHNGLTSSIGNAVFNKSDGVIIVVDNFYSAATGGQDILSSRATNKTKQTQNSITSAVKGMGVKWVRQIDHTYDVGKMRATLKEALTTDMEGPKVIVASSECMLNKQRRVKPQMNKAIKDGERVIKPRFGVDEDVCTGDHACMRLSGCPSLSVKTLDDPLRDDPVASIDQNCVGCGNCGEVADAAVLCPSFYRADVVHNPNERDRRRDRFRKRVIGWLQTRRESGRLVFQEA